MDIKTTDGPSADPVAVAIRSLHTMATGGRSDFDAVFHPDAVNRENKVQPPSSRVPGRQASTRPHYGCVRPSPDCTTKFITR